MTQPPGTGPLLAIDSGSPLLSVAVGTSDEILATSDSPAVRSSAVVMSLIDSCLSAADLRAGSLAGVVVLSGPGSFTGLRVGMSIALGVHQALGTPAGALSTFRALAATAHDPEAPVLTLVRALRSEWYARRFETPRGSGAAPERLAESEIPSLAPAQVVGFGVDSISGDTAQAAEARWLEPGPLAPVALRLSDYVEWGPAALASPTYLAPPPVRRPGA